jgi:hypothetical protein
MMFPQLVREKFAKFPRKVRVLFGRIVHYPFKSIELFIFQKMVTCCMLLVHSIVESDEYDIVNGLGGDINGKIN